MAAEVRQLKRLARRRAPPSQLAAVISDISEKAGTPAVPASVGLLSQTLISEIDYGGREIMVYRCCSWWI